MAKGPTNVMHGKSLFMLGFLLLCFLCGAINLGVEQLYRGEKYQKMAVEQQLKDLLISPERGIIYDRNMEVLAKSMSVSTVIAAPVSVKAEQRDFLADNLSEILGVDRKKIYDQLGKKNQYEILKRKITNDVKEKVSKFIVENKLTCIYLEPDNQRVYTHSNFASHILGFTGIDNAGLDGLESYYEKYLKGEPGRLVQAKNAQGTDMPFGYEKMFDAKNGSSLVLTIDETIQEYLEKNLERGITENKVMNKAIGIIMDVQTGEILALSVKPDYDSNNPRIIQDEALREEIVKMADGEEKNKALSNAQASQWRNKAISDTYEPGSVFKTFTMAAGLEEGVINKGETYYCPGYHTVLDRKMGCHKTEGHGTQTLVEAVVNSCNPAFMMIGEKLGAQRFFKYFKGFGFTEKTGVDLPGEASSASLYIKEKDLRPVELASSSFGQSNSMTAIQMITAMSAACNGGKLVTPHVVKQIVDNNNVLENFTPKIKRQVISEETSATIRDILEKVVSTGTGRNAYLVGYQIAGKTGTSQKLAKLKTDDSKEEHVASFCAFAPADAPKIACMVIFDTPRGKSYYGSAVAAPVARDIMSDVLPHLGIDPKYTEEDLAKMDVSTPTVTSRKLDEAKQMVDKAGLKYKIIGDGENVVKQIPTGGKTIPKNGTVVIYTDGQTNTVTVPNFVGKSPSEVSQLASRHNLNVKLAGALTGAGIARSSRQSVAETEKVEAGTVIDVDFIFVDSVE